MNKGFLLKATLLALLLCVLSPSFYRDLGSNREEHFHGDEVAFLSLGNMAFRTFFIERDFHHPFFSAPFLTYGSYHPPLSKYLMGMGLYLFGKSEHPSLELDGFYSWDRDHQWNLSHGIVPPPSVLRAARFPIMLLGLGFCLLLFALGLGLGGWPLGLYALLLSMSSPCVVAYSRLCMLDMSQLFFSTLALGMGLLFCRYFHERRHGRAFLLASLAGLSMGLAASCKLNGLLSLGIFLCFVLYALFITRPLRGYIMALGVSSFLLSLLLAGALFIALNPFLYSEPLTHFRQMLDIQRVHTINVWPIYPQDAFSPSPLLRVKEALCAFFLSKTFAPLYALTSVPLDLFLFPIGLGFVIIIVGRGARISESPLGFEGLIAIWIIITFALTLAWMPMNWERYYLPLIPCLVIGEGYALKKICERLRRPQVALSVGLMILTLLSLRHMLMDGKEDKLLASNPQSAEAVEKDPSLYIKNTLHAANDLFLFQDYQKALSGYVKVIKAEPSNGQAHYGLAMTYERMGLREKAQEERQILEKLKAHQQ